MKKICATCEIEKDLIDFSPSKLGKNGVRNRCKGCVARIQREDRAMNPAKRAAAAEAARRWAREHREQHNATKRARYAKDPTGHKKRARKAKYGITDFQFQQKLSIQGGGCAICGFKFPKDSQGNRELAPHVDHNHDTGKVRGILCHNCNKGLGHFKDHYELLDAASFYLKVLG